VLFSKKRMERELASDKESGIRQVWEKDRARSTPFYIPII
jgi:hypothetical protein